jgi:putative two-component system response regulator
MKIVFIVDDNDTNLMAAKQALEGHYKTYALSSAKKMLDLMEKITPDLILLDINMPEMDGFKTIEVLKSNNKSKLIPVIFLTARDDPATEVRGFELGAHDFMLKPFVLSVLLEKIATHINSNKPQTQAASANNKIANYLELLINELIRTETYVPEINQILEKIKTVDSLKNDKMFTKYHYEKWDGTGHPDNLSGENIPLEGRLMAVIDIYDALVSEKTYKKAFSQEHTIMVIKNGHGSHFDPKIVEAFLNIADEFKKVSEE